MRLHQDNLTFLKPATADNNMKTDLDNRTVTTHGFSPRFPNSGLGILM